MKVKRRDDEDAKGRNDRQMGLATVLSGAVVGAAGGAMMLWAFLASGSTIAVAAAVGAVVGGCFGWMYWFETRERYEAIRRAGDPDTGPADMGQAVQQAVVASGESLWFRAGLGALLGAAMGALAGGGVLGTLIGGGWNWWLALAVGAVGAVLGMLRGWAGGVAVIARQVAVRRAAAEGFRGRPKLAAPLGAVLGGFVGAVAGGLGWGALWPEHSAVAAVVGGLLIAAVGAAAGRQFAGRPAPPTEGPSAPTPREARR